MVEDIDDMVGLLGDARDVVVLGTSMLGTLVVEVLWVESPLVELGDVTVEVVLGEMVLRGPCTVVLVVISGCCDLLKDATPDVRGFS